MNVKEFYSTLKKCDCLYIVEEIMKEFSIDAAVFYGALLERCKTYTIKDELYLEDDWFIMSGEEMLERTGMSRFRQEKAITLLLQGDWVDYKLASNPQQRHFRLNLERLG